MKRLKLALIGTFYGRYEQSRACLKQVLNSSRLPDEIILMCETGEDAENLRNLTYHKNVQLHILETPKTDGVYDVIPYSNKINFALDHTDADLIVYLDNGSMPHIDKYKIMAAELEAHPEYGAVYCSQQRTGFVNKLHTADKVVQDPYCVINYTQGMHRKTDKRWPTDMKYATPNDVADALFWRSLQTPFHPINKVLDEHHMESTKANGL